MLASYVLKLLNITAAQLTYTGNGINWQAVLRTVRWRKRGWFGGCSTFRDSLYFCFVGFGGREAELKILNGCLQHVIFWLMWIYIFYTIIDSSVTMILWGGGKNTVIPNSTTIYYYGRDVWESEYRATWYGNYQVIIVEYGNMLVEFSLEHRCRLGGNYQLAKKRSWHGQDDCVSQHLDFGCFDALRGQSTRSRAIRSGQLGSSERVLYGG